MSTISDSSQEALNAASITSQTPVQSPNIFIKTEPLDIQSPASFQTPDILKTAPLIIDQSQKRRSSSRSIKRKKFDDELVESSLVKSSRPRPQSSVFASTPTFGGVSSSPSLPYAPSLVPSTSSVATAETTPLVYLEKRRSRPSQKSRKKPKSAQASLEKDAGRWKPADDLLLILSVIQTNNLEQVHRGVTFSSKFILRDVQERWYSLLYDPNTSKAASFAIKQLSPETIAEIQSKVLYSVEEEQLIAAMPSDKGSVESFQELLGSNASVFSDARTAKGLFTHWSTMKQYNLLKDQRGHQPFPAEKDLVTFSDMEEGLDDSNLLLPSDEAISAEISGMRRINMGEVKKLENEVPKWQVLVEYVTGISIPDFDSKTLAVLKGRTVRYLIQSREVTFGRNCADNRVDIDLTLEGPSWKVSRRQGVIKLDSMGDFHLTNEGKKNMFVDGKPVQNGSKFKLSNNSVIEISVLRFIFIVNLEAVAALKAKCNG